FGYTAKEAVGQPITLIIPPERIDEERAILDRLRRGERVEHFETVRVTKDGRRLDISLTVSPLRDDEGQVIGASKVARDITERKRAEAERRRLQEEVEAERSRLAEVFHRAPSFLAVLRGAEHVFELANDRYDQLIGERNIIGKPVCEALPEVEGQGFFELLDRVYRSGETFAGTDMRVMVQRHPGQPLEERFVEFVYQPLRGPDGSVSGILAQGIDLTDRKRAEATVRERDERLRLFLGNATDYAFIITDPEGLTLAWEGGAERITGWRADEMFGKGWIPEKCYAAIASDCSEGSGCAIGGLITASEFNSASMSGAAHCQSRRRSRAIAACVRSIVSSHRPVKTAARSTSIASAFSSFQ
ncbi:MAG TPA: PAS domain S-box protein, partial [Isosphaeraceae bacterium]|nr:PAS domain S-box protein [Isosphaeraceae bacterium]